MFIVAACRGRSFCRRAYRFRAPFAPVFRPRRSSLPDPESEHVAHGLQCVQILLAENAAPGRDGLALQLLCLCGGTLLIQNPTQIIQGPQRSRSFPARGRGTGCPQSVRKGTVREERVRVLYTRPASRTSSEPGVLGPAPAPVDIACSDAIAARRARVRDFEHSLHELGDAVGSIALARGPAQLERLRNGKPGQQHH